MLKSHSFRRKSRHLHHLILIAGILPVALAVQALGVTWNGAVSLNTGSPGLDNVHVLGNTVVTLTNTGDDNIIENLISFEPTLATETLTVNGAGLTLRSLATLVSIASNKAITINGTADFAPGALSFGSTVGATPTVTGVSLIKNGGTGTLILDDPSNFLAGTTDKLIVLDGRMSIVGGGGVNNPISTLTSAIELGVASGAGSPVLRIGSSGGATTFNNLVKSFQNSTVEHVTGDTDTLSGANFSIKALTTLTINVAAGGLVINGAIADPTSTALRGGTLKKMGNDTTLTLRKR